MKNDDETVMKFVKYKYGIGGFVPKLEDYVNEESFWSAQCKLL